jgi:hypothetical protein
MTSGIKEGQKFRVKGIYHTEKHIGINPDMIRIARHHSIVEVVALYDSYSVNAKNINNKMSDAWRWHIDDLTLLKKFKRKSSKPVIFDERLLDI